ncbi:hypothetical protein TTHT_0526 [Thermotomaculum hydrothermale]|uniref:DUF4845 domain-containing protein n=1 Tax=Thermotomaculum hydrothermale TaxID=981385 RepID=A0A7R6PT29_9BACT|nr:hypothetical protein [Thermotomaculum hydrothermale]BBB32112.1 hypothetical protein TTHT_0526 [Thermotomaculum hydrothermale]
MLNKRGESKIGCLIYLVIFAYIGYLLIQVAPVFYNKEELRDQLDIAARSYYQLKDRPEVLYNMILKKARELQIPLRRQDIRIKIRRGEVEISAEYEVEIDFLFTKKIFVMRPSASMPIYDF